MPEPQGNGPCSASPIVSGFGDGQSELACDQPMLARAPRAEICHGQLQERYARRVVAGRAQKPTFTHRSYREGITRLMKVLVATKSVPVFEALRSNEELEIEPVLFTRQIVKLLPTAQLIIIDLEDVVEYGYETAMLRTRLEEAQERQNIPYVSSEEFLADPEEWLARAGRARGGQELPDKLTIGFTGYSGGVGKTTLALDTALHFARRAELPVLLIEFVYGTSALAVLTGVEATFLYDLATDTESQPAVFRGVTLVPMDYDNCRLLAAEDFARYLKSLMAQHVLTVVDAIWPHGLLRSIQGDVDQWFVMASPRLDAVENANKLAEELGTKASIVVNNQRGAGDSLALAGVERALSLSHTDRVDRWEGKLGRQMLDHLYGSAWKRYEKRRSIRERLFG